MLTSMQATSVAVGALLPATEINAQHAACASMPTAIGNASRRHGIEKKVPKEATAHPAAITSTTKETGGDYPAVAIFAPTIVNPKRPPAQIRSTTTPA
jgi:hypothetical protein